MSIYLHYLDRELRASVECALRDDALLEITGIAALMTPDLLYCSLSFLFETCLPFPILQTFFLGLIERQHLQVLSSHPTLGEFIESRRLLYAHDARRYPMYFHADATVTETITLNPHHKLASTTESLVSALRSRYDAGTASLPAGMIAPNAEVPDIVRRGIDALGEKAVTFSAFSGYAKSGDKVVEGRIRRGISDEYTRHYLSLLDGDLITGISGLGYYDRLDRSFPRYDLPLLRALARCLFPSSMRFGQNEKVGDALTFSRGSPDHHVFTEDVAEFFGTLQLLHPIRAMDMRGHTREEMAKTIMTSWKASRRRRPGPSKTFRSASDALRLWMGDAAREDGRFREAQSMAQITRKRRGIRVLLCTATDVEDDILKENLDDYRLSVTPFRGNHGAYARLGAFGPCELVWVRSRMGTTGPDASELTTVDAIDDVHPDYVISYGICFGKSPSKQAIGDVLVSEWVRLYEKQKVEEGGKVTPRGERIPASGTLLQLAEIARMTFKESPVRVGGTVSGDKLVDSAALKATLLAIEPEAIGGDMEGAGIVSASERRGTCWIVVKAICDWGENKNVGTRDKDADQRLAATNSLHFVFKMLADGNLAPPK